MPDEPNEKMDAMLRAYAKKRGEAPLAPLHPATRRMLQDEARRVHGRAPGHRAGWALWWPRLAFASSLCLVAVLTIAVLRVERPPEPETAAASKQANETSAPQSRQSDSEHKSVQKKLLSSLPQPSVEEMKDSPAPAADSAKKEARQAELVLEERAIVKLKEQPAPSLFAEEKLNLTPAPIRLERDELDDHNALAKAAAASAPAVPAPVLQDAAKPALDLERERLAIKPARADFAPAETAHTSSAELSGAAGTETSLALKTAPPAPASQPAQSAARPESLARAANMTNLGAALRTKFVQTNQATIPVLRTFQMEQLGEAVRLVDLDGSVYTGRIQRATEPASVLATSAQRTAVGRATALPPDNVGAFSNKAVFSFTANGMNRTLGAPVQVQGQYFRATNAPALEGSAAARPTRAGKGADALLGRTVVGGSNEAPLRAISADR